MIKIDWDDKECFDRICNLIINHTTYTYKGRFELLNLMLKNEKKVLKN